MFLFLSVLRKKKQHTHKTHRTEFLFAPKSMRGKKKNHKKKWQTENISDREKCFFFSLELMVKMFLCKQRHQYDLNQK